MSDTPNINVNVNTGNSKNASSSIIDTALGFGLRFVVPIAIIIALVLLYGIVTVLVPLVDTVFGFTGDLVGSLEIFPTFGFVAPLSVVVSYFFGG